MNNLEKRIEKLETRTGVGMRESKTWVIIQEEPSPTGVKDGDKVIIVTDEDAKQMLKRVLSGEMPQREDDKW